ncbi:UxaA family hydrolase [Paraglaciecola aquimarina]|uniref:UxaA family hydrolase n=1 Tax=Paraglaciecola aquimarina TaxID=1235557 RepID=A0ABU3SZN8_9ALTE|nr:UxaA family hydrolase [Paraglaciecola aquimarina]MDU0355427.1 UxaA family hydrolase [Paraglaciecola aquimarina]
MTTVKSSKFVLVNKADNVLICCQPVKSGELVVIDNQEYRVNTAIDVGHKMARVAIAKLQKIIRYGVPIGSATADIQAGEHVHMHNMKSDYIPSHI